VLALYLWYDGSNELHSREKENKRATDTQRRREPEQLGRARSYGRAAQSSRGAAEADPVGQGAHSGARRGQKETYTVQAGDTLGKIAQEMYGDGSRWREIWEANKGDIPNPDLIQVGQELVIP